MAVLIDDETLQATGLTADELRLEIAVTLFREEKLTLPQAAKLAGLTIIPFQQLLAERRISPHYDVPEFRNDLDTLHGAGLL